MKFKFIIFCLFIIYIPQLSVGQYENAANHSCLKCHSQSMFSYYNEYTERQDKRLMNPYYILDTIALVSGVHNFFDCIDCHSYDYTTYPHDANLKLEPMLTCLDCHGGDESFASYQFERIDEEVKKSTHYQKYNESFTCNKCHDLHTYRPIARTSNSVREIVEYSNTMCLTCHNDMKQYQLMADRENPQLVEVHNWLPNQDLHFNNVRCIECHTEVEDSLMVSHNIMKKENAVRNCVECHTKDSRLKASLYKYENLKARSEDGNVNTVLANESYVIGTQQSPLLKLLSIIIFFATLAGIATHLIFRIINKK